MTNSTANKKNSIADLIKVGDSLILSKNRKSNPKLGIRLMGDGRMSFFLDYYFGFQNVYSESKDKMIPKKIKRRETIKDLYYIQKPRTTKERATNRHNMELAEKIQRDRANDLLEPEKREELQVREKTSNFHYFYQQYYTEYDKKDKAMIRLAYNRFLNFLKETDEYTCFAGMIKGDQMTSEMIEDFCFYLQHKSRGEGAQSIFKRFKKIYRAYAMANNLNARKPFTSKTGKSITIGVSDDVVIKDFLNPDEEKKLIETTYPRQNKQIRNAFIFCLYTGMRFCDIKALTFGNFDFSDKIFSFDQSKTTGHSKHSRVTLPITNNLLALMGDSPESRDKDELVFNLPTHDTCNDCLQTWVKKAGISKHITWHCARHSFGTNMAITAAQKGFSIRLVQDMMGHSNLKYTERYTRVVDDQKRQAMTELSKIMEG